MIDRAKVEKALQIAEACKSANVSIRVETGKIEILVYAHGDKDAVWAYVSRLQRVPMGNGEVWGEAHIDGIKIQVVRIGKCDIVYEEREVAEMVPTGQTVKETVVRYVCPDGPIEK